MNYRERRNAYLNCEKRIFDGVGYFDFPSMNPVNLDISDATVIGFNYAKGCKDPEDKICHFYLDDYQFERVWNDAPRYTEILKKFKAVLSPDFSLYADFPKAVQIFNHYRKMWCSAYWQEHDITVIPTICWSDEESFDWCFDGIPKNSLISISTVGGFGNHDCNKEGWLRGYERCIDTLKPKKILLFGKEYPEINLPCETVVYDNTNLVRKRALKNKNDQTGISILEFNENEKLEGQKRVEWRG